MREDWDSEAACKDHESLHPDAWFCVRGSRIHDEGFHALAVCQRTCPVRLDCREALLQLTRDWPTQGTFKALQLPMLPSGLRPPTESIFGGGWLDSRGNYHQSPVETVSANGKNLFYRRPIKMKVIAPDVAEIEEIEQQPEMAA